jgi:transposase
MPRIGNTLNHSNIITNYLNGISEKALAEMFNVSRQVIKRILIINNIERRGRSASMYLRMANSTPDERQALSKKAHDAIRGVKRKKQELTERAITRQKTRQYIGQGEELLNQWLIKRGFKTIPQMAVDRFNIDIAIPPVAVELKISSTLPITATNDLKKIIYLTNNHWSVIYIQIKYIDMLSEIQADYIARFIKQVRSNPSLIGEYRVIGCNAKLKSRGRFDID